ncbi:MAG: flagellar hook-length control protein FliK [Sedimentisphaerales bacterium]|nr:flagellar hook-length control protein FliK [Sedimentisphaerales bacterium]MBN2843038.1 flagellar hook-length control protein FliK [Sedimentisphaerales bacterium]
MSTVSQTTQNATGRAAAASQNSTKNTWDKTSSGSSFFEVFSSKVSGDASAHNKQYEADSTRNDKQMQAEKNAGESRTQATENKDRTDNETDEPVVNESQAQQKDESRPVEDKKTEQPSELPDEQETQGQELLELPEDLARQLLLLQMQAKLDMQNEAQNKSDSDSQAENQELAPVGKGDINIAEKNINTNIDGNARKNTDNNDRYLQNNLNSEQDARQADQVRSQSNDTTADTVNTSANADDLVAADTDMQVLELDLADSQNEKQKTDTVTRSTVVNQESAVNADEKTVKTEKKDQAGSNYDESRIADLKYKMENDGGFEQNADMAGNKEKDQSSRQLKFNFGDETASISGVSTAQSATDNVKQALALDKSAPTSELNASATVDTVVKSVKTMVQDGNSTMVVRLDPPSLGQLSIKISSGSDGMSIEIQASNAKTQEMLQQNSSQLRTALEKSGVSVNNVDIQFKPETRNNSNAGSDPQNNQQDLAGQHKNPEQRNGNDQDSSHQSFSESWSTETFEEKQFATADSFVTAGAGSNSWQELSFDTVDVRI